MNLLQTLGQLRDDIKQWVTTNLVALDAKIESKAVPIDNKLDGSSTNPVQNKAISNEINAINTEVATLNREIATIDSEVEAIKNDLSNIEGSVNDNIIDDESGEFNLADPSGNVIFKVDANGAHTTNLTLNGKDVENTINTIEADINTVETDIAILKADVTANNTAIEELENHTHDFNDLTNKPNIEDDKSGEYVIADDAGNIIFKVDAEGTHTTDLTVNGKSVAATLDTAAAYIDELETKVDNVETAVDNLEAGVEAQAAAIGELKNHNHDYNELENAPAITDDESGEVVYADEAGNVIARIDANGIETTTVCAKDIKINGKSYTLHDHNSAYDVKGAAAAVQSSLGSHTSNKSNPHGVTAAQVGADPKGSADAVQSNLTTHINKKDNPHGVTLSQLGLTADAIELNYVDGVTSNIQTQLNGKAASSHGTHVTYGTSAAALGTSSAGSATTVSRSDHVHALPALTSCTGTLTVAKGGTGLTSSPSMLVNLGSTSAASVLAASPRPGVTGTLGIANGGTGATTAATARTNLGAAPAYSYGTSDLTAGSSSLETGKLYFVYE